ncbi:MAG: T9SS type A sorting domain-containing protein [Candidatus Delongbacteria bacterium]|nr:T9SS type A sorting domain-containing protein [Candidatus Cloacimonadota bacterium]MCA9785707.1 T9SS type A sorting domain-containing protein [Candidatus Cloacimonadota bacterium]MCB9474042.1 T9SS type A sorting domain-containing protein [Candidatus Delongbacteria bacterium]
MRAVLLSVCLGLVPLASRAEICIQGTVPGPYQVVQIPFVVEQDCCDWSISTCGSGSVNTAIGSVEGPGVSFEGDDNPGVCPNPCLSWAEPDFVDKDHGYNWITPGNPPECMPAGNYTLQLAIYLGWDASTCTLLSGPIPYEVCFNFCSRSAGTEDLPAAFSLGNPYPNPFNPSTTIDWSLDHTAPVTLSVHDLAGREVAVLVSGLQNAGEHSTRFEAAGLPSGVYFATLEAEGFRESRKLVLLK